MENPMSKWERPVFAASLAVLLLSFAFMMVMQGCTGGEYCYSSGGPGGPSPAPTSAVYGKMTLNLPFPTGALVEKVDRAVPSDLDYYIIYVYKYGTTTLLIDPVTVNKPAGGGTATYTITNVPLGKYTVTVKGYNAVGFQVSEQSKDVEVNTDTTVEITFDPTPIPAPWQQVAVEGVSKTLYGIDFYDESKGWIVGGDSYVILKTTDGGASWFIQKSGTDGRKVRDVAMFDWYSNVHGFAVGMEEITVRRIGFLSILNNYADEADAWDRTFDTTENDLWGIDHTSGNYGTFRGAIVGVKQGDPSKGVILYNYDSGYGNFQTASPYEGTEAPMRDVAVFESMPNGYGATNNRGARGAIIFAGVAVGDNGKIYYAERDLSTWYLNTYMPAGFTNNLWGVYFADVQNGWAVGDGGAILHTTDTLNWQAQNSGTTKNLRGVFFKDASTGWAVGEGGVIVHTTDGGATWALQNSGTTTNLWDVYFTSLTGGVAIGEKGLILRTTSGGK